MDITLCWETIKKILNEEAIERHDNKNWDGEKELLKAISEVEHVLIKYDMKLRVKHLKRG